MRKLFIALALTLLIAVNVNAQTGGNLMNIIPAADCSWLTFDGFLCQDTDDHKLYKWNGATQVELTAGGDATSLQGYSIATTAPTNTYVLTWNSSTSKWEPAVAPGAGTGAATTLGYVTWQTEASLSAERVLTESTGIDFSTAVANQIIVSVNTTEIGTTTWGSGGASYLWTFNVSGTTDPVLTLSDGVFNISAGTIQQAGTKVALGIATSTDNRLVRWDSTSGQQLQNSAITVDDTGNVTGMGTLASGAITATGAVIPGTANTYALGSDTAEWSTLYLGSTSGVIYFLNDQSVYLTPSATTLTLTGAFATTLGADIGGVIKAGSGDTTLTDAAGKILSAALNTVGIGQGGTGATATATTNGIVYGASATAYGLTAAATVQGQILTAGASPFVPLWTTATYPLTVTTGGILYASGTNIITQRDAVATGSILVSAGVTTAPVYSAAPILGTSLEVPFIILGSAATAADAGAIRLPNGANGLIAWELAATGTDVTFGVNSSDDMVAALVAATDIFQITTGNFKLGAGTQTQTLDGADAYITGKLEVDELIYADGGITGVIGATGATTGAFTSITATTTIEAEGVITAGTSHTALTDAAGKILSAALNTVAIAQGGTGATAAATTNGIVYGASATALGMTAIGAEGQLLRVGASPFVPAWSTYTSPATITTGGVFVANTANVLIAVTWNSAGNKVLTNASGVVSWEDAAAPGAHAIVGASHTLTGATTGTLLAATAATTLGWTTAVYPLTATTGGIFYGFADNDVRQLTPGATTTILVGGGATAAPVWTTASGTGAPARVGSPTFTGDVILPSSNADPAATAGALRHDNTVSNFTNGALVFYDGVNIKQIVSMTTATASACTGGQLVGYDSTDDLWKCVTASGTGDFLADGTVPMTGALDLVATGVKLSAANGVLTILGQGNGYDENMTIDFNTTENVVAFNSGTAATFVITPATKVTGILSAGSGPTTLTDSAGKILSAALNTVGIGQGGTGATAAATTNGVVYGASATAYGITAAGATTQPLFANTSGAPTFRAIETGDLPTALPATATFATSANPDTDGGATLGTKNTAEWQNLYLNTAGTIEFENGNVVLTHSTGILTLTTGTLALGANNLTMTGSIAATGNPAANVWATKVNDVTISDPGTGATLTLADGGSLITSGAYAITLTASTTTNVTLPGVATQTLLNNVLTEAYLLIGNSSNVATGRAISGDITVTTLGVVSIGADKINTTHIDWGAGANQVDLDDIPDSATYHRVVAGDLDTDGHPIRLYDSDSSTYVTITGLTTTARVLTVQDVAGQTLANLGTAQTFSASNTFTPVQYFGGAAAAGSLRIYDGTDNYVTLNYPTSGANTTFSFPLVAGTTGYFLQTDGSGNTSWSVTGIVTAAGDCAGGACYDGSSDGGTYIRLYDGTSAYESITGGVRLFTFASSTALSENLILTLGANDNTITLSSGTSAATLNLNAFSVSSNGLLPDAAGGADIGSASAEWQDLYLGNSAVIKGQLDQSATLTSSASTWTASAFTVTGALTANGSLTVADGQTSTFNGNTIVGNADTDTLTIRSLLVGGDRTGTNDAIQIAATVATATYATTSDDLYVAGNVEVVGTVYGASFNAGAGTDGQRGIILTSNTALTPTADQIYFINDVLYFSQAGTQKTPMRLEDAQTATGLKTFGGGLAASNGTSAGFLDIYEGTGSGTNKVRIQSQAMAADYTITLPVDDGTPSQFLLTDGSGNLSWGAPTATAAGSAGSIQYTSTGAGGALEGSAHLIYVVGATYADLTIGSEGTGRIGRLNLAYEGGASDYTAMITPNASMSGDVTITLPSNTSTLIGSGANTFTGAQILSGVNPASGSLDSLTLSGTLGIFDGLDTFRGIYLNYTDSNHTGTGNTIVLLDTAAITGDANSNLYGIRIGNLTGTTGAAGEVEHAIKIGTGWDIDLELMDNTATITHSGTTSLTIASTSGTVVVEGITFTGDAVTGASNVTSTLFSGALTGTVGAAGPTTGAFTSITASTTIEAEGVITAGTSHTALTDAAGKILSAALNTVAISQGGTGGTAAATTNGIVYGASPTAYGMTAAATVQGQILMAGASPFVPAWTTATFPATATTGGILYGSATNVHTELAAVALGSVLTSKGLVTAPAWDSAPEITSVNLGHASDTTITRVNAGIIAVEGATVPTLTSAPIFTSTVTAPLFVGTLTGLASTATTATATSGLNATALASAPIFTSTVTAPLFVGTLTGTASGNMKGTAGDTANALVKRGADSGTVAASTIVEDGSLINAQALNLVSTGNVSSLIKVLTVTTGLVFTNSPVTVTTDRIVYGGVLIASTVATIELPAVAIGMSLCVYSTAAQIITIHPAAADRIILDGAAKADHANISSPGAAGNFICLLGDSADGWMTLGRSGTWVSP